eukprot:12923109-Prorocentrum_lima.AAC.1
MPTYVNPPNGTSSPGEHAKEWYIQPRGTRKSTCRLCYGDLFRHAVRVFRGSDRITGGRALHLDCLP